MEAPCPCFCASIRDLNKLVDNYSQLKAVERREQNNTHRGGGWETKPGADGLGLDGFDVIWCGKCACRYVSIEMDEV